MDAQTVVNAPWTTWWQTDMPCLFSPQRATQNREYLVESIGNRWLNQSISKPGRENNAQLQRWISNGAGSFLELNLLAEDLRVLDSITGIEVVIDDLRDAARCLPAWHVLHSAALFERKIKGTVVTFFSQ